MPTKEELLREKRIYGLPETISMEEVQMLSRGMPIQKIIGYIQFNKVKINVNRGVLIPRYETEEVVKEALKHINKNSKVLDLCTGSGFIGLTIKYQTQADVTMSDISKEAILQSQENAALNNLHVNVIQSDLFENIEGKFDVIVANPPYLPKTELLSDSVLDFEPQNALFAEKKGNYFYEKILEEVSLYLNPGGTLIFEISSHNSKLLKSMGFLILEDINKKERIAIKKY